MGWGIVCTCRVSALSHILNLTQRCNYQNYSSRLRRSPGRCLRGQTCLPLALNGTFPIRSAGRQVGWVWAESLPRGFLPPESSPALSLAWPVSATRWASVPPSSVRDKASELPLAASSLASVLLVPQDPLALSTSAGPWGSHCPRLTPEGSTGHGERLSYLNTMLIKSHGGNQPPSHTNVVIMSLPTGIHMRA